MTEDSDFAAVTAQTGSRLRRSLGGLALVLGTLLLLLASALPRGASDLPRGWSDPASSTAGRLNGRARQLADVLPAVQEPLRKAQSDPRQLPKWLAHSDGAGILPPGVTLVVSGTGTNRPLQFVQDHPARPASTANRPRAPPVLVISA